MWCKLVGACLQASGRYEMLSRFPTKVVCPHCLQGVTLKEAADQMHFTIVSQMQWLAPLWLAHQPIRPTSLLA